LSPFVYTIITGLDGSCDINPGNNMILGRDFPTVQIYLGLALLFALDHEIKNLVSSQKASLRYLFGFLQM